MGHIRLGRIPKTRPWQSVFDVLNSENISAPQLAQAIGKAAQNEFRALKGDATVSFCYWVLTSIISAAKTENFVNRLEALGINVKNVTSTLEFVKIVSQYTADSTEKIGRTPAFTNIAELSLKETLSKAIVEQSKSLFETSIEDIQLACKKLATEKQFGRISRYFFSNFVNRSLQYVSDKELSNFIGPNYSLKTSSDALSFQNSLSLYCLQSSKIVEDFSGGWFSKQLWKTNNNISHEDAKGFMAYALEKVHMELGEGLP